MKAASGLPGSWSAVDRDRSPANYVDNPIYQFLFSTFAFILGAAVGSFLNVCIYRLPLDLSGDEPRNHRGVRCQHFSTGVDGYGFTDRCGYSLRARGGPGLSDSSARSGSGQDRLWKKKNSFRRTHAVYLEETG